MCLDSQIASKNQSIRRMPHALCHVVPARNFATPSVALVTLVTRRGREWGFVCHTEGIRGKIDINYVLYVCD